MYGFQWIDGSFIENIETIHCRDPRDIDVVTFFHLPEGDTQQTLYERAPLLFNPANTKKSYRVDAHYVPLNAMTPESLVDQAAYWYSVWSHRRRGQWKGYVRIDLSSTDDQAAKASVDDMSNDGGDG